MVASYASRSSSNPDRGEEAREDEALALGSPRTVMTEGVSDTFLLCFDFLYALPGMGFKMNFFIEGRPTLTSERDSASESPKSEEDVEPVSEIREPISTERRLLLRLRFMPERLGEIEDPEGWVSRWISTELEMAEVDELLPSVPCEMRLARLLTAETSVELDVTIVAGAGAGADAGEELGGVGGACA